MTQSATHLLTDEEANAHPPLEAMVVRFAGDSGDGMQLTGGQFTLSTALAGNDLATFPDFPAEIRAPQGTTFGVSAFQINFGSTAIDTAGDQPDVLVAMNPAALKTNVGDAARRRADHRRRRRVQRRATSPRRAMTPTRSTTAASPAGSWSSFNISQLTLDAVKPFGLGNKEALRCKNMWTLGLALWMFDRDRAPIVDWLKTKFAKAPELAEANIAALNAGHAYGETVEIGAPGRASTTSPPRPAEPGLYRTVTGAESLSVGLVAGAQLAGLHDVLRRLSDHAGLGDPPPPRRASRNMASPPSRRRTRSPRSAPRSAPATPASSASPPRRARASRSRARRWASRS